LLLCRNYTAGVAASSIAAVLAVLSSVAHAEPDGSAISDDIVRIAVLGDYGSGRDLGGPGSVTAAKLAAEDIHNTVLDKPVQIISADH
jgi:branched-chain amino acid transport system substrate-binding protein